MTSEQKKGGQSHHKGAAFLVMDICQGPLPHWGSTAMC